MLAVGFAGYIIKALAYPIFTKLGGMSNIIEEWESQLLKNVKLEFMMGQFNNWFITIKFYYLLSINGNAWNILNNL